MRIGYFGGSFDPPHRGHLAVARAAASAFALDTVLLVPTSHQPLKSTGPIAPYADRLAMVTLLCAEPPQPTIAPPIANIAPTSRPSRSPSPTPTPPHLGPSTLEAPLPNNPPHYTVDTLQRLRQTLAPTDDLYVLAGADAFLQFSAWRDPATLLTLADWIIVSRPSFDLSRLDLSRLDLPSPTAAPLTPAQRARIHLLPTLADPTSATTLRYQLATHTPDPILLEGLPATILTYIHQHHLYGT